VYDASIESTDSQVGKLCIQTSTSCDRINGLIVGKPNWFESIY